MDIPAVEEGADAINLKDSATENQEVAPKVRLEALQSTLETYAANRDEDLTVYSNVPDRCKTGTCYLGIDEAGRGPVLGPMVYAIFAAVADHQKSITSEKGVTTKEKKTDECCPPVLIDRIKKLNDSKQLTEKIREEIFEQFADLDHIAYGIKIISPAQISAQSYKRQKVSLNEVSHNAAMELIQGLLDRGVKIEKVFVDTVGPMDKYQKKLELKFPELKFKVDKKADSKYKPVSAASICAKVTRDEVLRKWTFSQDEKVTIPGDGWGSGYPGDDVTKRFLRANIDPVFGFPNIVRDSWSTASDLLDKRAVKVKWEVEEEDVPNPKIFKFLTRKQGEDKKDDVENFCSTPVKRKSQFFSYRNLSQTAKIF